MRVTYQADGSPVPIYESGDMVRLVRDEPGPIVTARAGEWGEVLRVRGRDGLDIRFAGFSRPSTALMPVATAIPTSYVAPCDRRGVPLRLQRDLRLKQEIA
jgi:hypothetical protein